MVINFKTNTAYEMEFLDIVRAFSPDVEIDETGELCELNIDDGIISLTFAGKCESEKCGSQKVNEIKRQAKIVLYKKISETIKRKLPYGSITGIRPTKLFHELLEDKVDAEDYFINYLLVSKETTMQIKAIVNNQSGIYDKNEREIDLFVNIPICVSRCTYCSFISAEYGKIKKLILSIVSQMVREIEHAKALIATKKLIVRSIYVGGGTPTSLDEKNFYDVLLPLSTIKCKEFTVEAGRPDTITLKKLEIMRDLGVSRISINPQTFNDKTLELIGRKHSVADIFESFKMAKNFNFSVNMDLIAMLPNESLADFTNSVDTCVRLNPDNITIHTLAIKRGSNLKIKNYDNQSTDLATQMINYSRNALLECGYLPYYMYKQKYMSGSLENTGYTKPSHSCIYNIDIMEETHTILACGAGGISKRVFNQENRLERLANPKGIDVYLLREDRILKDKQLFFD